MRTFVVFAFDKYDELADNLKITFPSYSLWCWLWNCEIFLFAIKLIFRFHPQVFKNFFFRCCGQDWAWNGCFQIGRMKFISKWENDEKNHHDFDESKTKGDVGKNVSVLSQIDNILEKFSDDKYTHFSLFICRNLLKKSIVLCPITSYEFSSIALYVTFFDALLFQFV